QNRSTRGETLRRGSNRRAEDDPVAAEGRDLLAVDGQINIDQVEWRPGPEHDLIESEKGPAAARSFNRALVHQMPRHRIFAADDARQQLPAFLKPQIGEKAELPEIDAEHWTLPVSHLPRRSQDGAVAAEHQSDFSVVTAQVHLLRQVYRHDLAV